MIRIPFPPSVNHYYLKFRNRVVIGKRGREYRKSVSETLGPMTPRKGKLAIVVVLCPPDRRRRDVDNFQKCLFDSLTKANVWEDDSQVDFLCVIRGEIDRTGGSVLFAIEDAGDPAILKHIRDAVKFSDLEGKEIRRMKNEEETSPTVHIRTDSETAEPQKRRRRATTGDRDSSEDRGRNMG